jgi:hypothetical protein
MEGIALLQAAHKAGLKIVTDGSNLVVRGPRKAAAIAMELLAQKAEILRLLSGNGNENQPFCGKTGISFPPPPAIVASPGAGCTASQLQASTLAGEASGLAVEQVSMARNSIEILALAGRIIAESDGRSPQPNPTVHQMFADARTRLGFRDVEERSITSWLRRNAPDVATKWPEAPLDASWFDWRLRVSSEQVLRLDEAFSSITGISLRMR